MLLAVLIIMPIVKIVLHLVPLIIAKNLTLSGVLMLIREGQR